MDNTSVELYRKLCLVRQAEELIIEHYGEDEMKTPMHMSMGQEAVAVGVCHALREDDQIFATYRSHAAYLAKTDDPEGFFAELYGRIDGPLAGRGGSMHLANPDRGHLCSSAIVGSCLPVALGAAFANKYQKNGKVVAVFFGDGAMEEGSFWESVNVACLMKLPVLLVCENNQLAVHTWKRDRQSWSFNGPILELFGAHYENIDSFDVEVVYKEASKFIEQTRNWNQPGFLTANCYRVLEHVGINEDFSAGYRSRESYEQWKHWDPLEVQGKRLSARGTSPEWICAIQKDRLRAAIKLAKTSKDPQDIDLYRGVFRETD